MSKKNRSTPTAEPPTVAEIVSAQVVREQAWAYQLRIEQGYTWPAIRGLALRPLEHGGIGRHVGIDTIKNLVAGHRAAQGEIVGTREERNERRTIALENQALRAQAAISAAADDGRLDINAEKLLAEALAGISKMHGDDTPVEVTVMHRDAAVEELNAMLGRLGKKPIEVTS